FFFDHTLELAVDKGLTFRQAPFGFVMVGAALGEGSLGLAPEAQGFFTGFGAGFMREGLGFAPRAFEKGFPFDAAGCPKIALLPSKQPIADKGTSQEGGHPQYSRVIQQIHFRTVRGLLSDASASASGCN